MANLFAALITVIIIVITFFIFNSVIKPIAKLTKLLNDMSNEKQVTLNSDEHHQNEINSVITAANALYLKNKQTKEDNFIGKEELIKRKANPTRILNNISVNPIVDLYLFLSNIG